MMTDVVTISVGLEEGADGAAWVHALSLPGCAAAGATREEALAAFEPELADWLDALQAIGERVPGPDTELEIAVDEWVQSDARVASGESTVCFDADLVPLGDEEIQSGLQRLGDLRGLLLPHLRRRPAEELDRAGSGGLSARQALEELARAQWWTLSRLGATPLADPPPHTLGRLDTAMALVVQQFTGVVPQMRDRVLDMEGELWSPRKVLRRLLWLEWTLGRLAREALPPRG